MSLIYCFFTLFIASLLCFEQISAASVQCKTVTVDQSGRGDFSTIQSAINSVPSKNGFWYCINVNPGTYREKLKIPRDKPFIVLKGCGQTKTKVVWNEPYLDNATFTSLADNIIVESMSFVNIYNGPRSKNPRVPALAAMVNGDKSFFYQCGFSGVQDTLWDATGRHYFKECYIEGAVDFIFGRGQTIYEGCTIRYLGEMLPRRFVGFITAQGRDNPSDPNGFVFKNCNIYGKGATYLGRPWREYSRVLFYNCNFSKVVYPLGWQAWKSVGKEQTLSFSEYKNYGAGADTSKRVKWVKKLDPHTVGMLTSMSYINSDGQNLSFSEYKNYGAGADTSKRVKWMKKLEPQTVDKLTSMSFIDSDGWLQSMPVKYI